MFTLNQYCSVCGGDASVDGVSLKAFNLWLQEDKEDIQEFFPGLSPLDYIKLTDRLCNTCILNDAQPTAQSQGLSDPLKYLHN